MDRGCPWWQPLDYGCDMNRSAASLLKRLADAIFGRPIEPLDLLLILPFLVNLLWVLDVAPDGETAWVLTVLMSLSVATWGTIRLVRWRRHRNLRRLVQPDQKCYVCSHVFDGAPVLLVERPNDGDWCFLCGVEHPDETSSYRLVRAGHVLTADESIAQVLDLPPGHAAERGGSGMSWRRSSLASAGNSE